MRCTMIQAAAVITGVLLAASASAANVGWRQIQVTSDVAGAPAINVALYYPTDAPARQLVMGPFTVNAAFSAPAQATAVQ